MGVKASATGMDRRSLLLGGALAGAAGALGLADSSDAYEPREEDAGVVIGRVAGHRGSDQLAVDTLAGGTIVVQALAGAVVVASDGSPRKLSDFAVGDAIAVDVDRGSARGTDAHATVGARRVTPCVLGSRSDAER